MILHSTTSRATPVRVLLTGANGGYGRTLLDQLRRLPDLTATQLVDPDVETALRDLMQALVTADEGRTAA